jgi:beta-lactamase regulating signal transducer with metallopeptidase domain
MKLVLTQPWVVHLGWTLLHFLWQGTLIAIVFAVARALLSRALTAHARYCMACATLGAMTAAPVLTYIALARFRAETAAPVWQMFPAVVLADAWQRALPWLVMAWLGGVVVFSARLIGGWRLASRIRSAAVRPAPAEWQQKLEGLIRRMGAWQPVRLLISSLVEVPTVVGWLRPVILMPVGALTGLPAEHVSALLAHELAHVRRHDYLANILQSVVEAVLFYHPAVWWVSEQIRAERELCCDDLAVALCGGDVLTYARALADVESFRPAHAGTVLAANGGSLASRIRRLIGQPLSASQSLPGPGAVVSLALLWLAGIGAVAMHGSTMTGSIVTGSTVTVPTAPPPPTLVLPTPAVPFIAPPPKLPVLSAFLFDPFFEPPQAPPAAAPASASLSGRAINSVTGAGVAGAEVSAWINDRGHAPETITDDTGAFRFAGIPDGAYAVMAMKDGFFPAQSSFESPVRVFGDTRFDLKMTPNATMRGRVLDPQGKPAAGVSVKFGPPSVPVSVTDGKGEFVFEDVPSIGAFTLSATPNPQPDAKDAVNEAQERIVTTYYPSVVDSTQAAPINVSGVDLSGYEIRLRTAPARGIRGVVIDVDGKPAPHTVVSVFKPAVGLVSGHGGGSRNGAVVSGVSPPEVAAAEPVESGDDGTFAFPPVIEGNWRVRAVLGREGFNPRSGGADVTVSSSDIDNLEIRLTQQFEVEVEADWGNPPPATAPPTQVMLVSLDGATGAPDLEESRQPQRFKISVGRHFIGPGSSPPGYYAAAAMLGNRDVLGQVVELSGPATLKIIYKTDGGSVRGTVENGAGATVMLMADATPFARLGLTARCDGDGGFTIRDVPPGEYTVVAGQGFLFGFNPEMEKQLKTNGKRVHVDAQAATSVDLHL